MDITAAQCRAGRALLDWTQRQLALASRVSLRTITEFEGGARQPIAANRAMLRLTLEQAGVRFRDEGGVSWVGVEASPESGGFASPLTSP